MITVPPKFCRSCSRALDAGRCFHCGYWLCACGKRTGSALRSLCNDCDRLGAPGEEPAVTTTVYGKPAVTVPQPDGEEVAYLIREEAANEHEWRAWVVTSPKGEEHRVSEYTNGFASCSCPAWKWNRHAAGRWCDVNGKPCCKHISALLTQVIKPEGVMS